jgi:hypothetical protein
VKQKYKTAVSLLPLPSSSSIRLAVERYMVRQPSPGDILRSLADRMDAAAAAGEGMAGVATHEPPHEAAEWLPDYRQRANRRTYRCTYEHAARLEQLSAATGLSQTTIIRLALAEERERAARGLEARGGKPRTY